MASARNRRSPARGRAAILRAPTAPDAAGVVRRDLGRYYALLERERPGAVVTPMEACLIRDALPALHGGRRNGGDDATLAGAVAAHAQAGGGSAYEVDVPAPVERLRALAPLGLLAVIDPAERMHAAVLQGDFAGRERVRREFGIGG